MKIWKMISNACAHLSIVWSLMLLTFYVTDRYNDKMAFINHDMTKGLVTVLAASTLVCAVYLLLLRGRALLLRLCLSIPASLAAIASAVLLAVDRIVPRYILFTYDDVKAVLAVLAVTSIAASLLLIVLDRRALRRASDES
ncbi:MAG: hypothetical protein IJX76_05505 [Clostridia bacterium]|nr:hypothetical protein [Clostridia bacterium]